MKVLKQMFLLLLLTSNFIFSQTWVLKPAPTNREINSVFFINDNIGWIVGEYKSLYKTTDGGNFWENKSDSIDHFNIALNDIFFINENIGWLVGYNETIYHTVNGGNSWIRQKPGGSTAELNSVYFTDELNGWTAGEFGKYYYTTDGGENWISGSIIEYNWKDIFFIDSNIGWLVGNGNSTLFKTYNGGQTWVNLNFSVTPYGLNSIKFYNANVGWIAGDYGKLYRTNDGGNSWEIIYDNQENYIMHFKDIFFCDIDNGWAIGDVGMIFSSHDSGSSWNIEKYPDLLTSSDNLNSAHFLATKIGYAVGHTGTILKRLISPPDIPVLISPQNQTSIQELSFLFDWSNSVGADFYNLQVSTNNNFSSLLVNETQLLFSEYQIPASILTTNQNYFWRVNASNSGGSSNWTNPWQFQTIPYPPDSPNLISPSNGAIDQTRTLTLDWTTPSESTEHSVQIATDSNFSSIILNQSGLINSQFDVPLGILFGDRAYYWRAKSSNNGGSSNWSEIWYFTTREASIELTSPSGGEKWSVNSTQEISWISSNIINVDIFYSITNGASWSSIETNYTSTGQYPWLIPNSPSQQCLIKITETDNSQLFYICDSAFSIVAATDIVTKNGIPTDFAINQNYPNPFNPSTSITYELPENENVLIVIYNSVGEIIETLVNEIKAPGRYSLKWDASAYSSGVYFYRILAGEFNQTRKMLLMK